MTQPISDADVLQISIEKQNPNCPGCGCPVAIQGDYCGECMCEEDEL